MKPAVIVGVLLSISHPVTQAQVTTSQYDNARTGATLSERL